MGEFHKLGEFLSRHTHWPTHVVLERDEDGTITKEISTTQPAELEQADLDKLKELGVQTVPSSKEEAESASSQQAASGQQVGSDVIGSSPLLGGGSQQTPPPSPESGNGGSGAQGGAESDNDEEK